VVVLLYSCTNNEFLSGLLKLTHDVWKKCTIPSVWFDAILVPIPMKGDLRNCDNLWGISLLDAVGKMVARTLQERLQKLTENELSESQCDLERAGSVEI
jgi:hypothetical protein